MITATFIVHESDTPAKIGTETTRELMWVERNSVPVIEYDGVQVFSMDKKTFQTTIVASSEIIQLSYVFPTSELALDNEFRISAGSYGDTVELDMSSCGWHSPTMTVAVLLEDITTEYIPIDYHRRTFSARVISST